MINYLCSSGTTSHECETFLTNWDHSERAVEERKRKYCFKSTFQNFDTVGSLVVKVYRAKGLYAADLGGSSDPFCILELGIYQKWPFKMLEMSSKRLNWFYIQHSKSLSDKLLKITPEFKLILSTKHWIQFGKRCNTSNFYKNCLTTISRCLCCQLKMFTPACLSQF